MLAQAKRLKAGDEPPDPRTMDADGLRRAGYLAEFVGLLLPGSPRDALLAWADTARCRLRRTLGSPGNWPTLAAVPGAPSGPASLIDAIALDWRISPPLSRDRYLSEEPTL